MTAYWQTRLLPLFSLPLVALAIAPNQILALEEYNAIAANQPDTSHLTTATSTQPPLLLAQNVRTRRINFARGRSSAVVENAVVRGERDVYLLNAKARQKMTVSITSLEKNAVFDITSPNGKTLRQEATSWSGALPATGQYKIVVGGTRGNASYKLQVGIK
jgi:hypothetical protein